MEVSSMYYTCRYCVFTLWGRSIGSWCEPVCSKLSNSTLNVVICLYCELKLKFSAVRGFVHNKGTQRYQNRESNQFETFEFATQTVVMATENMILWMIDNVNWTAHSMEASVLATCTKNRIDCNLWASKESIPQAKYFSWNIRNITSYYYQDRFSEFWHPIFLEKKWHFIPLEIISFLMIVCKIFLANLILWQK